MMATPSPEPTADPNSLCVTLSGAQSVDSMDALVELLHAMDYDVNPAGGNCHWKLDIRVDGKAVSGHYQVNNSTEYRDCFTGAQVTGEIGLSAGQQQAETAKIDEEIIPPNYIQEICPEEAAAPVDEAERRALVHALMNIFGDQALVMAQKVENFAGITELLDRSHYSDALLQGLIGLLDDPDPWARYHAAYFISCMSPFPTKAVRPFLDHLKTEKSADPNVRSELWSGLINAGPVAKDILPDLIEFLNTGSTGFKQGAAEVIERMGNVGQPAEHALATTLKDPDAWVRIWSARALGEIGATSTESLTALIAALSDPDPEVVSSAGRSLAALTGHDETFFQDANAWEPWWQTYLKTGPTPTPTPKPVEILTIQAPEPFLSVWNQWDHRYVVYVHRSAGIQKFADLDGMAWYVGLMGADPQNSDPAAIANDVIPLENLPDMNAELIFPGEPDFENYMLGSTQGTDFFETYFLDRPDFIGIMVPELAKFYKFDQNQDLICVEFTGATP
jgi:hypothetical protein